ncbi:MAG: type II secretion system protein [Candidatus Gottesmanbacteria bacterium]|nr:type II secretion system protein [Candidatus Gottesmanbacteria bacterium]
MKKNKSLQGFTLMEILISVGILAIVATLLAQVLFTTAHVNKKTEILTDIKQDGNFALDIIGRMVRSAKSIDKCLLGELDITNPNNNVTIFTCDAGRIASESASHPPVYLTSANVTLSSSGGNNCTDSSLAFSCPLAEGQVTIKFTLGQLGVAGSAYESGSAAFESTVRMRN